MRISMIIATVLLAKMTFAQVGPTVECRFAAFEKDGDVGLDESVVFTMTPGGFVEGSFEPYDIELESGLSAFEINVHLDGKLISRMNFPLVQIENLPVGATVFGISASTHKIIDGLESIQYECRKVF